MLFNSIEFYFFILTVFSLYWLVFKKSLTGQNWVLLLASYFFYGWWDWRFLFLIAFSSLLDFTVGKLIEESRNESTRKRFLWLSVVANLGLLGFFKYYNFFASSLQEAFQSQGVTLDDLTLNIILPVGISFYTFQTLSYTIDIYKGKIRAERDPVKFFAFVSFFPQLVAGPIERASNLLPQFQKARSFDGKHSFGALQLIAWGFFKKIVIADNCALIVNEVFSNHTAFGSLEIVFAVVLFAFQIYGDFSGYSDIAIGISRLFGVNLMVNFRTPYFSRDIAEFWRRWHISLSTWFRNYLYIPLGGSRFGKFISLRNTVIVFLVSGFWHGANWTFIVWGGLHALLFLPLLLTNRNRNNTHELPKLLSTKGVISITQMLFTFGLVSFAWIFFRADSLTQAADIIQRIATSEFNIRFLEFKHILTIYLITILLLFDWTLRNNALRFYEWSSLRGFLFLLIIIPHIVWFGVFGNPLEFIYFQF